MGNRWRGIAGAPEYEVSAEGAVRRGGRDLKLFVDSKGRKNVTLSVGGRRYLRRVHVLVLEAFVSSRPDGLVGCHINGDPSDNRVSNLRWGTYSENELDSVAHGTHPMASKTHCPRAHEYSPQNTVRNKRGSRECRTCIRDRKRMRRRRG